MRRHRTITTFEHARLIVGDGPFVEHHFDALVKFNDQHDAKFFEVGRGKIKFKSYVGIFQVGDLAIEILPKADNLPENSADTRSKWQKALLYMLRHAGYLKLNEINEADQNTQNADLIDLYLHAFIKEVEKLVHLGLVKKYERRRANQPACKGRIIIEKQIRLNNLHKERFYTEHTVYNRNHPLNCILKKALTVIRDMSCRTRLRQNACRQLLYFEDIKPWQGSEADLEYVILNRKTLPYAHAFELAKMILLNYCPDMSSGKKHVLALLFDMNILFEKFMFHMIKKQEERFKEFSLSVEPQISQTFWGSKTIRPDIIVSFKNGGYSYRTTIDTKWKIAGTGYPGDDDLKQMFTYNIQFHTNRSLLLYPSLGQNNSGQIPFDESMRKLAFSHTCEMYFIDLFEEGVISEQKIYAFLNYLIGQPSL
jgi:5-methylcytosine-specific restriction enzyme subunit McrC